MNEDKKFVNGMIFKSPPPNCPDFLKGKISVKIEDFKMFMDKHNNNGWINIDLKESKGGKLYFELNDWKPKKSPADMMREGMEKTNYPEIGGHIEDKYIPNGFEPLNEKESEMNEEDYYNNLLF